MTDIATFPGFSVALPVAMLFGSLLISSILRISKIGTIAVASLALPLPFLNLPFATDFCEKHPEYVIGGAWAVMLAAAIGWVLVRPVVAGAVASLGVIKFIYLIILAGALTVTGVLMVDPEVLTRHAPGWRGTAGLVLLSASLLSMSLSLARVLKAALFLVVWSFVSIVLASEVFLHKLPQHIVREDLRRIESLVPSETLSNVLEKLDVGVKAGDSDTAFVLGGSPVAGFRLSEENSFSGRVRRILERSGRKVAMHDAALQGSSIDEIRRAVHETIEPFRPKFVFLVGWAADKNQGYRTSGSWGLTRWRDGEPNITGGDTASVANVIRQAADLISSSTLYNYCLGGARVTDALRPRVSAEEYREQLTDVVRSLRAAGSEVVLVSEPVVKADDKPYRDAMVDASVTESVAFVPADSLIAQVGDPRVFSRGTLLSGSGMEVIAGVAVEMLMEASSKRDQQAGLGFHPTA